MSLVIGSAPLGLGVLIALGGMSKLYRVAPRLEDDGNDTRRSFGCKSPRRSGGGEDGNLPTYEIDCQLAAEQVRLPVEGAALLR